MSMQEENRAAQQEAAYQNQHNIGKRISELSDKPITPIDEHSRSLEASLNSLERCQLQLDNLLDRVRGAQPKATQGAEKIPYQPETIIERLRMCDERLNQLCNEINNQVDELGSIF